MRLASNIAVLVCLFFGATACLPENSSNLQQLHHARQKCMTPDSARIQSVTAKINARNQQQPFIQALSSQGEAAVLEKFALLPDVYIDWMLNTDLHVVGVGGFGGNIAGLMTHRYGLTNGQLTRLNIKVEIQQDIYQLNHAILHEFAHVVELYYMFGKEALNLSSKSQWDSGLDQFALSVYNNPQRRAAMHSYPKSYIERQNPNYEAYGAEFFAEAVDSYYCSPASQNLLKQSFPETVQWLESAVGLAPALWDDRYTAPWPSIANPAGTSIGNSIVNTTNNPAIQMILDAGDGYLTIL